MFWLRCCFARRVIRLMSWFDFFVIFLGCAATMLLCRTLPFFVLKGHSLRSSIQRALILIPPAAFAALVSNDLFSPTMFDAGVWQGLIPLIAAVVVVFVGIKTKSLLWCAIVGVAVYAALSFV